MDAKTGGDGIMPGRGGHDFAGRDAVRGGFGETGTNAGWSSLGRMPASVWDGKTLQFHNDQGTLAIAALSDDVSGYNSRGQNRSDATIRTPSSIVISGQRRPKSNWHRFHRAADCNAHGADPAKSVADLFRQCRRVKSGCR